MINLVYSVRLSQFLQVELFVSPCFTDFPTEPTGFVMQYISEEANRRLGFYLTLSPEVELPPDAPPPPRLPADTIDVPLVRLFNFLRLYLIRDILGTCS